MRPIRLEVNGKLVSGYILKSGSQHWVHVHGRLYVIEEEGRSGTKATNSKNPKIISAPMPGKIIKMTLKAGDAVKKGEVVVVMEAMKMEYSLKAEIDGTIQTLHCAPGEQVALGKVLVNLEEKNKG
jgi:acetyl/propionyl-CoA carboxylase alpha subunit